MVNVALLSPDEKKRVEAAVAQAEENTAGELAVVLTQRSDEYGFFRGLFAVVVSTVALYELGHFVPQLPRAVLWSLLPLSWGGLYLLAGVSAVLRRLVPREHQVSAVAQRASSAFIDCGITETRDRSGVLLFLSESEHRVVIVADKGIHQRVESDEWEKDVATIVEGIKAGTTVDGLIQAIERIGGILAEAFPPRQDDKNELSNQVREI